MYEFIDREVAKAKIREKFKFVPARIEINEVLNSIPAADVRPVRVGKLEKYGAAIRCSVCGFDTQSWDMHFCPNCGAEMEES